MAGFVCCATRIGAPSAIIRPQAWSLALCYNDPLSAPSELVVSAYLRRLLALSDTGMDLTEILAIISQPCCIHEHRSILLSQAGRNDAVSPPLSLVDSARLRSLMHSKLVLQCFCRKSSRLSSSFSPVMWWPQPSNSWIRSIFEMSTK